MTAESPVDLFAMATENGPGLRRRFDQHLNDLARTDGQRAQQLSDFADTVPLLAVGGSTTAP